MKRDKLRNFGKFLGVYLLAALGAIMLLTSCDKLRRSYPSNYDRANDSVKICEMIENVNNPQFSSVTDVMEFRVNYASGQTIDSVFFSLPDNTIRNVVGVLLKSNTNITKKDIIEEYRRCKDVYDKLPVPNASNEKTDDSSAVNKPVDKTATDLGTRQPVKTEISFRTDTVNGKPKKVMVKTEEYYE